MSGTSNTILVGSNQRLEPSLARARKWLTSDSTAFAGISRYGMQTAEIVLAQYWTGGEQIRAAVAADPVNTLDHPRYEFYSPDDYAVPSRHRLAQNFDFLMQFRSRTPEPAWQRSTGEAGSDSLMRVLRAAEDEYLAACSNSLHNASPEEVIRHLEGAVRMAPWNDNLRARIFAQYWEMAGRYLALGIPEAVAELDRLGLRAYDREPMAHVEYALALERIGRPDQAVESARRAVAMAPDLIAARRVLAELLIRLGQPHEARVHLQTILAIEPTDEGARQLLEAR